MARNADDQRLDAIAQAIRDNPGRKPGWLARLLGCDNKTMMRALVLLEERGELLAEDQNGRLSSLGRRK